MKDEKGAKSNQGVAQHLVPVQRLVQIEYRKDCKDQECDPLPNGPELSGQEATTPDQVGRNLKVDTAKAMPQWITMARIKGRPCIPDTPAGRRS
jgi:hypothetical protein